MTGIVIFIVVIVLVLAVLLIAANKMVTYGLTIQGGGGDRKVSLNEESAEPQEQDGEGGQKDSDAAANHNNLKAIFEANEKEQKQRTEVFRTEHPPKEVYTTSKDGLKLAGFWYAQPLKKEAGKTGSKPVGATKADADIGTTAGKTDAADEHKWAILIHGYGGSHVWMEDHADRYYAEGYHVLLPDLRACGDSEGLYMGMGWLDRLDILRWISWIVEKDPEARIVLHGVSMGAATVMMTSGEDTPDQVVAFVEDCGYDSAWNIFASELRLRFHLPPFPILYLSSLLSKLRAGYTFGEASSVKQIRKCQKPFLFIHGTADGFVPYSMMDIVYAAKPGTNKKKISVEGADHAVAHYQIGDAYWNGVFEFLKETAAL